MNYELEVSRSLPAVFDSLSTGETRRNYALNPRQIAGGYNNGGTPVTGLTSPWPRSTAIKVTPAGAWTAQYFGTIPAATVDTKWVVRFYAATDATPAAAWNLQNISANQNVLSAPYTGGAHYRNGVLTAAGIGNNDTAAWHEFRFTVPANTGAFTLGIKEIGGAAGAPITITAITIERAEVSGTTPFDGSDTNSTFVTHSWTGAVNNSVSIQSVARPPLVAGSGTSALLGASRTIPFSAWNKGEEDVAFSLEAWHLPITNTGELIVMGHITEGLFWDGDEYILRVIYDDNTALEARWRPVEVKARHLVVTYDVGSFTVFADAVPVISLEALRDKPFKAIGPINLNNGIGTGQYDSAALYYRALSYSEILSHFTWGRAVAPARDISAANGGATWTLSSVDENKYDTIIYDESSWNLGNAQGVSYFKDIVAESEAGGTWQVALPINTRDAAALGGIALSYVGQGVTMSHSTDGVTWTVVPNRSVIMQDAVADGSMLFLQFVLADGNAWLNSVTVEILVNREMPGHSGQRVLSFRSAHMDRDLANQLEYQSAWGANLTPSVGSGLVVAPDGATTGAVELWFKRRSNSAAWAGIVDTQTNAGAGGPYLGYNGSVLEFGAGSVYVNGVSVTAGTQLEPNVWHHIVFSFFTPSDLTITIGSNRGRAGASAADGSVGHVALYPGGISAGQAASLYQQNMGASILRVDDTSQITLSEEAGGPKFFANNWSYVSGGS